MKGRETRIAANTVAYSVSILLLAAIAGLILQITHRPDRSIPKVLMGTKDEVFYSHAATREDAEKLGHALQALGFFQDRGTAVLLSKNPGGTVISFVVSDGLWNNAPAVSSFEEIGRRIAGLVGGFPIEIRLVDSGWKIQKTSQVGKISWGSNDEIYYLGSATEADGQALGQALQEAGYLKNLGVSVSISKGDVNAISFVVGDSVWQQRAAVTGFEHLARKIAPSIGGLPLQVRLLNPQMEVKAATEIR